MGGRSSLPFFHVAVAGSFNPTFAAHHLATTEADLEGASRRGGCDKRSARPGFGVCRRVGAVFLPLKTRGAVLVLSASPIDVDHAGTWSRQAGVADRFRSMGEPVVDLKSVYRAFKGVVALEDVSFAVQAGTVTVLLGPNGAGKTTAARVITGSLRCDGGSVMTFGVDPTGPHGVDVRRRCGVVAANPALYDRLTGRDNLVYAARLYRLGSRAPIESSAAHFGIVDALDQRVGGYSTGMKTRLALARAVLHDPELLLLDEPTSGLDPESSHAVLALIDEMAEGGKTVVMCTHLLLEAEGLADQVVMLESGRNLLSGPPDALVRRIWPRPTVVFDAEERTMLDRLASLPGVTGYVRDGGAAVVTVDDLASVPDLVGALTASGARLTKVTPHEPTLEELYFAVRNACAAPSAPAIGSLFTGATAALLAASRDAESLR
jgi:ABC-2 type transport system ATP-binding protein